MLPLVNSSRQQYPQAGAAGYINRGAPLTIPAVAAAGAAALTVPALRSVGTNGLHMGPPLSSVPFIRTISTDGDALAMQLSGRARSVSDAESLGQQLPRPPRESSSIYGTDGDALGTQLSGRPRRVTFTEPMAGGFITARTDGDDLLRGNCSSTASNAAKACDYIPDAGDDIDVELFEHLQALRPDACAKLHLFRKAQGIYEIEGRQVSLLRIEDGTIVVREEQVSLQTYLDQSAYVTLFLDSQPRATKMDALTFGDARIPDDTDPFTARLMCMKMACDQAERRQAHQAQQARPVVQQRVSPAAPGALALVAASTAAAAARPAGFTGWSPLAPQTTSTSAADVAEVPTSAMRDAQANTNENGQKQGKETDLENEKEKALESPTRSWWQKLTGQVAEPESEESSEEEDESPKKPAKSSREQRPKECL